MYSLSIAVTPRLHFALPLSSDASLLPSFPLIVLTVATFLTYDPPGKDPGDWPPFYQVRWQQGQYIAKQSLQLFLLY